MSHARYIVVLSHHQPIGSRSGTAIPAEIADQLVQRMAAERINQQTIRMMPPDSVFAPFSPLPSSRFIPDTLPPAEVGGHRFDDPVKSAVERCRRFRMRLHARAIVRGLLRQKAIA